MYIIQGDQKKQDPPLRKSNKGKFYEMVITIKTTTVAIRTGFYKVIYKTSSFHN